MPRAISPSIAMSCRSWPCFCRMSSQVDGLCTADSAATLSSAKSSRRSPVGVRSMTTSFSRSVSTRSRMESSISTAPASARSSTTPGISVKFPLSLSCASRKSSSAAVSIDQLPRLLPDGGDAFAAGAMHLEEGGKAADIEDLAHRRRRVAHGEAHLGALGLLRRFEQHAQPSARDVFERAEIEQHRLAAADRGAQLLVDHRGGGAVHPPVEREHGDAVFL